MFYAELSKGKKPETYFRVVGVYDWKVTGSLVGKVWGGVNEIPVESVMSSNWFSSTLVYMSWVIWRQNSASAALLLKENDSVQSDYWNY